MKKSVIKTLDVISLIVLFITVAALFSFSSFADGSTYQYLAILLLSIVSLLSWFFIFVLNGWKMASKVAAVIFIIVGLVLSTSFSYVGPRGDLEMVILSFVIKYWVAVFGVVATVMVMKFWGAWKKVTSSAIWAHLVLGVIALGTLGYAGFTALSPEAPGTGEVAIVLLIASLGFVLIPVYLIMRTCRLKG